jgi:predicted transglutaminase-like cysteine proteinase
MPYRPIPAWPVTCARFILPALVLTDSLAAGGAELGHIQSLALARYGQEASHSVSQWRELITDIRPLSEMEKLNRVNQFFNDRIRWSSDNETWQRDDYWATPLEVLARAAGDCEDFSIAKYITLLLAGVAPDKMRITYVRARKATAEGVSMTAHMVLAYYGTPAAEPRILDNLLADIRLASRRRDLKPVFGFNSEGLWLEGATSPATHEPGARLSRWHDVLQRMADDGIGWQSS